MRRNDEYGKKEDRRSIILENLTVYRLKENTKEETMSRVQKPQIDL